MSMGNRPSFSREAKLQWAGSREKNLASGRGRTFFLTSLFIELIDSMTSEMGGPERSPVGLPTEYCETYFWKCLRISSACPINCAADCLRVRDSSP